MRAIDIQYNQYLIAFKGTWFMYFGPKTLITLEFNSSSVFHQHPRVGFVMFGAFLGACLGQCGGLNKEHPISVNWGSISCLHLLPS